MANEFKIKNGYLSEGNSQITGSLNVSGGITGSLFGTSSYAIQALSSSYYGGSVTSASYAATASYVLQAVSASYATQALSASYAANGGVTKILAGANVNLSPISGLGDVTITSFGTNLYNTATGSYGSFYDTGSVLAASATAIYSMSLSTTDISNGVFVSASNGDVTRVKFTNAGTYNVQFSSQFSNSDNANQDIVIWVRKNGSNIADSSGVATVPPFKAGSNGQTIASWNYYLNLSAGDYIQLCWHVEQANVITLETIAAGTSPIHPRTPSTILTAQRVDTFLSNTGSFSGSFTGVLNGTASYATQALSASYATTASYLNTLNQDLTFNGNLTLNGTASITYLNVSYESASVIYSSGSNQFGDASNDTQTLYGSVIIPTGSLTVSGALAVSSSQNSYFVGGSNVGIGTTTPGNKLSVVTGPGADDILPALGGNGGKLSLLNNDGLYGLIGGVLGTGNGYLQVQRVDGGATAYNLLLQPNGGNVGIGTTTPSNLLTVKGNANNMISIQYASDGGAAGLGFLNSSGTELWAINGGRFIAQDEFAISRQGTTALYINSSRNVGIGTTTPAYRLDVNASSSSDGFRVGVGGVSRFIIVGDGVATWGPTANAGQLTWDTGKAIVMGQSGQALSLGSNGSWDIMYINTSGNVGIGTITPAYKLSVVGKMALNDGGDSVFIGTNAGQSDDATANLNVAIGTSALQNNLTGASNVAVGNLALNTNLGSTNTALGANALQLNTTGVSNTAVGASSQLNSGVGTFNTSVGTNTLLFCASGSSNAAFGSSALRSLTSGSNNAALGTSALFTLTSGIDNTAVGTNAISNNTTGSDNTALGRSAGRYFGTGTSTNLNASASIFIGKNSRANATGETNQIVIGNEALGLGNNTIVLGNDNVVTTALKGNVGIGTNVPMGPLEIYKATPAGLGGHLILNNDGSSIGNETAIIFNDSGVGSVGFVRAAISSTTEGSPFSGDIKFKTGNTSYGSLSTRMIVTGAGNVGIGTTSTNELLTVNGNVDLPYGYYLSFQGGITPVTAKFAIKNTYSSPNDVLMLQATGNSDGIITFHAGSAAATRSERMRIDSSGNVGIGTTSIAGNSTNRVLSIEGSDSANLLITETGGAAAAFTSFGNEAYIGTSTNHPFYMYTSGSERLRIATNGALKFNAYGSGTFTGTAAQKLAVDSSGNLIEIPIGAGPVDGSGTANYITRWVDTDTITTSSIYETGGNIGIGTTSPGSKLQIGSSDSSDQLLRLGIQYNTIRSLRGGINWHDGGNTTGQISTEYDGTMVSMVFGSLYNSGYNSNNLMIIRGNGNVGIGTITPAYKLSVVGKIALNDGGNSVFIGDNAGQLDDATANNNIAIGTNASQNNVSGSQNVAVGHNSLVANTNSNNTAVGANALQFNTTALNNTAFGSFALNTNTVGSSSIAVGAAALLFNTIGNHNTAVGNSAIRSNVSGSQNVGVGGSVMFNNTNGSDNVALGWNSARYFGTGTSALTDTSGSIFLGTLARANASGEVNQIVIGMNALGLGSNSVVLGNDNVTTTILKGNVGIGTTTPSVKLHVSGSISGSIFWPANAGGNYMQGDGSGLVVGGPSYFYSAGSNGSYFEGNVRIRGGLSNDTAAYMQINGGTSGYTYINGNLGVGTSTPSALLSGTERVIEISNSNLASIYLNSTAGKRWSISSAGGGSILWYDLTAVAERMRIDTSGNVGIGTASPSYLLDVNGTARVTTLIETSALKYKTNIQPLESQLSKVTQLEPVTFDWIDKPNHKTNIGLIADEVEKIYPEFVSKTEDGEIEGIEYSKLTTVLIQSIKELKEIVDKQQAQINTLLNK